MYVPAFQVFTFNFVKRPIISALWYAFVVHLILEPFSTAAILISSALIAVSFFSVRFYMAIVSPVPMIASVVLSVMKYPAILPYVIVAACIWSILYIVAMVVTVRCSKDVYYIDSFTGVMYKR